MLPSMLPDANQSSPQWLSLRGSGSSSATTWQYDKLGPNIDPTLSYCFILLQQDKLGAILEQKFLMFEAIHLIKFDNHQLNLN
jgi:hypothetical protein